MITAGRWSCGIGFWFRSPDIRSRVQLKVQIKSLVPMLFN